jgi:4-amino-4-deoxy-L-arabinose transferase-like glycosyltransferase
MGIASAFVFMLARSLWGSWLALASSLVWMTYPFALWLTKQPNSEIPFMVLFYGAFCLFWYSLIQRRRAWPIYLLSGFLMGLAMLIRPIAIGVGFVMGVILWLAANWLRPRSRLFLIMIMLLGNFAAVLPWEAWVYFKTGKVVPLCSNGPASLLDGLTFGVNTRGFRQGVDLPQDVLALMKKIQSRAAGLNSLGDVVSLMKEEMQTNPLAVAKLFIIKAARSWYATDSQRFETLIMLIQLPYLILVLWSSKLAWEEGGMKQQLIISSWLMILYFWAMTTVSTTLLRYMAPAMGLLFLILPALFRPAKYHAAAIKTNVTI